MAKFSTLSSGVSRRTSSHLTSSSSAMIWARPVPMCWPISALTICIVVLPSGVMVNQIDGVKACEPSPSAASAFPPSTSPGSPMLRNPLPASTAERTRKSRRVSPTSVESDILCALLHDLGGAFDRTDDPGVGGAAAQVAVHAVDDLLVGRVGISGEQRGGLHDLSRLAVAALRHLLLDPGLLHRVHVAGS